jgi:hypothetical protein
LAIWSALEPGLGIIASSVATLRPLFARWLTSFRANGGSTLVNSLKSGLSFKKSKDGTEKSKSGAFTSRGSTLVPPTKSFSFFGRSRQTEAGVTRDFGLQSVRSRMQTTHSVDDLRDGSPDSLGQWAGKMGVVDEEAIHTEHYPPFSHVYQKPGGTQGVFAMDRTSHAEKMRIKEHEYVQMKGRLLDSRQRAGLSLGYFEGRDSLGLAGKSTLRVTSSQTDSTYSCSSSTNETPHATQPPPVTQPPQVTQRPQVAQRPQAAPSASPARNVTRRNYSVGTTRTSGRNSDAARSDETSEHSVIVMLDSSLEPGDYEIGSDINRTSWHSSTDSASGIYGLDPSRRI